MAAYAFRGLTEILLTDVKSRVLRHISESSGIYGLMVYYTLKGNSKKHGEVLKQSSISLRFEN